MPDTTTTIPQLNLLNLPQLQAIQQQIQTLIKQGGAGPLTLPTNVNLAQLANINKQLEAFVQLASTILPILSTFVPQLKILIPILPVLTGLLKMGDDIGQAGNDPAQDCGCSRRAFKRGGTTGSGLETSWPELRQITCDGRRVA